MTIGGGTVEISRFADGMRCLGNALFISSGILVVAGKKLYCFFFKTKKERLAIVKFNCAME